MLFNSLLQGDELISKKDFGILPGTVTQAYIVPC